jgi:alanine racemase
MYDTFIEINKSKLIQNILSIKSFINSFVNNQVKICIPVKANAYGHDISLVTKVLEDYVDYFAVALLSEAITLRNIGISKSILIFGAYTDDQIADLVNNDVEITISSMYKARLIVEYCKLHHKKIKVHIKIDTGMSRIGIRASNAKELVDYVLFNNQYMELVGVYSHLANSEYVNDNITNNQIKIFKSIVEYVKQQDKSIICHLANSGGVLNYPDSYFDMIRPGILTYGYMPSDNLEKHDLYSLIKPVLSLKSHVAYFKVVSEGTGISYNYSYYTKSQTRILTIPLGYGDGYRRSLSNIGEVIIRNKKYRIIGNICMDMLMVDIGNDEAYVGDEVLLIGSDGINTIYLEDVAKICNTIIYEILCGFNVRIPRILVD